MLLALGAQGALETALADRVALSLWRLGRIARYDAAVDGELPEGGGPADGGDLLTKVIRYEAHVSRQMRQALLALEQLQRTRDRQPGLVSFAVEDTMELFDKLHKARVEARERAAAAGDKQ
jgi:hypothetical protein